MKLLLVLMLGLVMTACGASSAQVMQAKSAQYQAPPATIFELAKAAAAENYTIDGQPAPNAFTTKWQWYSKEGGRQSAGADGLSQISEGSVTLQLLVEVVETNGAVAVTITPHTLQNVTGSPKPRELKPDDPSLPPWVLGRVDALALAIHERAKQYAVKP